MTKGLLYSYCANSILVMWLIIHVRSIYRDIFIKKREKNSIMQLHILAT